MDDLHVLDRTQRRVQSNLLPLVNQNEIIKRNLLSFADNISDSGDVDGLGPVERVRVSIFSPEKGRLYCLYRRLAFS
jgi:hypothetical protein